jgi:cysteinyl-tRNA synthetase
MQRTEARNRKDWTAADRVRKELDALGVILEDGPQGTTSWRKK